MTPGDKAVFNGEKITILDYQPSRYIFDSPIVCCKKNNGEVVRVFSHELQGIQTPQLNRVMGRIMTNQQQQHHIKAGDRIQVKDCHETRRDFPGVGTIPIGQVLEVVDKFNQFHQFFLKCHNPINPEVHPFIAINCNDVELVAVAVEPYKSDISQEYEASYEKHKCYCPAANFGFNGVGCQCGGI